MTTKYTIDAVSQIGCDSGYVEWAIPGHPAVIGDLTVYEAPGGIVSATFQIETNSDLGGAMDLAAEILTNSRFHVATMKVWPGDVDDEPEDD